MANVGGRIMPLVSVNEKLPKIRMFQDFGSLPVIPQGFEPWTHALEGRCSNPTELRNLQIGCKVNYFYPFAQIFKIKVGLHHKKHRLFCGALPLWTSLRIHSGKELLVVPGVYYPVMDSVHCFYRIHVGNELTQHPHTVESEFVLQQIVASCA